MSVVQQPNRAHDQYQRRGGWLGQADANAEEAVVK